MNKALGGIGKSSDGQEHCREDFLEVNESIEKKNTIGKHTLLTSNKSFEVVVIVERQF